MNELTVLFVTAAGGIAGLLGALLGLGGGVFLVPFLIAVLNLPFALARGISLMAVVATSSGVSASGTARGLANARLAMLLQLATTAGGLTGALTSRFVTETTLTTLFAVMMLAIAVVVMTRLNKRNVMATTTDEPGFLGDWVEDPELGCRVRYRVRRLPLALLVSFANGNISTLLGLGGGIMIVPALNAWCGVPLRVAGATSALMIGVTAAAALPVYWIHGEIRPELAAGAVLGVLAGSRVGMRLVTRVQVRWLKLLLTVVLLAVSALMFSRLR